MIVGRDFNCVLDKDDSTSQFNYSRVLDGLVHGFELRDVLQADPQRVLSRTIPRWARTG